MSNALSDTGNTRLPRSTFSGTPSFSKNAMASRGVNRVSALYKNRPLPGMFPSSVSRSQSLVTLHRPLPVIFTFLPSRSLGSSSVTTAPHRAAVMAAISPAAPPPMTTISLLIVLFPEDAVLRPHLLHLRQRGGQVVPPLLTHGQDQRVQQTQRRGHGVHKGDHIAGRQQRR